MAYLLILAGWLLSTVSPELLQGIGVIKLALILIPINQVLFPTATLTGKSSMARWAKYADQQEASSDTKDILSMATASITSLIFADGMD